MRRPSWAASRAALALGLWTLGVRAESAPAAQSADEPAPKALTTAGVEKPEQGAAPESTPQERAAGAEHKREAKEAGARMQAAKLTPIVVKPRNARTTAFQLYGEIDIPVLATSAIFASARLFRGEPPNCAKVNGHCDPATLNGFDRPFAGTWRPGWATYSDVGLVSLAAGAATVLLVDEGFLPALNDMVVVAEAGLVATALPSMTTLATSRPRPFTYGTEAPLAVRNSGGAALSFISSHTSISFAVASSMFIATKRLHPQSALPWIVLGVGGATAASVAVARVLAGQHFPTDVIAGSVVGTSVGIVISSVHRLPVQVAPTKQGAEILYTGAF